MRNLNGYEIGGRTLRVDNACTEKSRMEMQSLLQGPVVENPYGEAVQADKAPEAISKAVASLPPEQMFELMKQMKLCVQNNPSEARAMLLQNPQLAYALLQAQVVMRIVDPHAAVGMLHKANPIPTPLLPVEKPPVAKPTPVPVPPAAAPREEGWTGPSTVPGAPRAAPVPPVGQNQTPTFVAPDVDLRPVDPRLSRMGDQDLRVPPVAPVPAPQAAPRDLRENFLPEHPQLVDSAESFPRDPRGASVDRFPPRDPRERVDPRTGMHFCPLSLYNI
ncbi:hypothetical protein B7P43_G01153 [Cryptotermes secundus]|nr:hypothetical protein B7P43_G01153 [Cryptotermes secundus]